MKIVADPIVPQRARTEWTYDVRLEYEPEEEPQLPMHSPLSAERWSYRVGLLSQIEGTRNSFCRNAEDAARLAGRVGENVVFNGLWDERNTQVRIDGLCWLEGCELGENVSITAGNPTTGAVIALGSELGTGCTIDAQGKLLTLDGAVLGGGAQMLGACRIDGHHRDNRCALPAKSVLLDANLKRVQFSTPVPVTVIASQVKDCEFRSHEASTTLDRCRLEQVGLSGACQLTGVEILAQQHQKTQRDFQGFSRLDDTRFLQKCQLIATDADSGGRIRLTNLGAAPHGWFVPYGTVYVGPGFEASCREEFNAAMAQMASGQSASPRLTSLTGTEPARSPEGNASEPPLQK